LGGDLRLHQEDRGHAPDRFGNPLQGGFGGRGPLDSQGEGQQPRPDLGVAGRFGGCGEQVAGCGHLAPADERLAAKQCQLLRTDRGIDLQQFRPDLTYSASFREVRPFDAVSLERFAAILRPYVKHVEIRGI